MKSYESFKKEHMPTGPTLNDYMQELLWSETPQEFSRKTRLLEYMHRHLMYVATVERPVEKRTLMAVALAYGADYGTYREWVISNGGCINLRTERDLVYKYLITLEPRPSIKKANEILERLGMPKSYYLGSKKLRQ